MINSLRSILSCVLISSALPLILTTSQLHANQPEYSTGIQNLTGFQAAANLAESQQIVGMTGFYGKPQPGQWLVLIKGSKQGQYSEFAVKNGKIIGQRKINFQSNEEIPSIPIDLSRLKIDSDIAYKISEAIAVDAGVRFDSVHYQLRCRDLAAEPVWLVNQFSKEGQSLGIHYISAETGLILRSVWKNRAANSFSRKTDTAPDETMLHPVSKSFNRTAEASSGEIRIQFGVFPRESSAEELAERLNEKGIDTHIAKRGSLHSVLSRERFQQIESVDRIINVATTMGHYDFVLVTH